MPDIYIIFYLIALHEKMGLKYLMALFDSDQSHKFDILSCFSPTTYVCLIPKNQFSVKYSYVLKTNFPSSTKLKGNEIKCTHNERLIKLP